MKSGRSLRWGAFACPIPDRVQKHIADPATDLGVIDPVAGNAGDRVGEEGIVPAASDRGIFRNDETALLQVT
jgi:hypothetical protein